MTIYDSIVIGGGVNGSATAFALSERKKNVLLLEQFPLPHVRGSSHGQSRVFRVLYVKSLYAKMSEDSIAVWRDMEKRVNEKLLIQSGNLEIYKNDDVDTIASRKKIMRDLEIPFEVLSNSEMNNRFGLFDLPSNYIGLYERKGGIVMANKCVAAFQRLFVENGGVLHDNEQVLNVIPGDVCTVVTNKQIYQAKSVVITAGAFSKKLLNSVGLNLPLQVVRTHLCFWKVSDPKAGTAESGFPSFMYLPTNTYGLAVMEYPGLLKICYHGGTDIDDMDYPDAPPKTENIVNFIRTFMKGVSDRPSIAEGCLYTNTPDKDFILDSHPVHKNIIIGAGFSGTGFKMSPVTGQVLADLAMGLKPAYDISRLRMERFSNVLVSKASL